MDCSTPSFPVHNQLLEHTQTYIHRHQWCHPAISSSAFPFSSSLQSFSASGSFLMSQFFASYGQSIGDSASGSVLPMNMGIEIRSWSSQGWGLTRCRHEGTSVQLSSVTQLCLTFCDPMNNTTPGLPVHHQLPEFTQTHVHQVGDAIQPSHLLSSPSPPAPKPAQHQSLFQWVNSSHEVAKVLEFQL